MATINLYTNTRFISAGQIARIQNLNDTAFTNWRFDFGDGQVVSHGREGPEGPPGDLLDTRYTSPSGIFGGAHVTNYIENSALGSDTVSYNSYDSVMDITTPISGGGPTDDTLPETLEVEIDTPEVMGDVYVYYPFPGTKTIYVSAWERNTNILRTLTLSSFFVVENFDTYNPDIFRIYLVTPLELPWACPKLPPNEWVTEDTINTIFRKFDENLEYLDNAAHMYAAPPTDFYGWFGTINSGVAPVWNVRIPNLDTNYLNLSASASYQDITNIKDIKIYRDAFWLVTDQKITARYRGYNGTVVATVTAKSLLDTFGSIGAIDIDPLGNMFVLDAKYNEVSIFHINDQNVPTYFYKWGGADSFLPKTRFVGANDIHADVDSNVFVVDTGNSCVKKFSPIGTWLLTLKHPSWRNTVANGGPISVTTDQNKNIHVLTFSNVYMFRPSGTLLRIYNIGIGLQPKKILTNYNKNGFIYVVYDRQVVKFTQDGVLAGFVTQHLTPYHPRTFNSATQDKNYNLFIAGDRAIYNYIDLVRIVSAKLDTSTLEWPLSAMQIDRNEFVQDWVYNRNFARLWDNMEIFRRSIYNKFIDQEVIPGLSALRTNYLTVSDELYFDNTKDDIVIGMNEFVTFEVINRVVDKLCANQEVIRTMLLEKPFIPAPIDTWCWSWQACRCHGINAIIWIDVLPTIGFKPTRWFEARSHCCIHGET